MSAPALLPPAPNLGAPETNPLGDFVANDGGPRLPGVDPPLGGGASSEPSFEGPFPTRSGRAGATIGLTSSTCFQGTAGMPRAAFFPEVSLGKSSVHPSSTSS